MPLLPFKIRVSFQYSYVGRSKFEIAPKLILIDVRPLYTMTMPLLEGSCFKPIATCQGTGDGPNFLLVFWPSCNSDFIHIGISAQYFDEKMEIARTEIVAINVISKRYATFHVAFYPRYKICHSCIDSWKFWKSAFFSPANNAKNDCWIVHRAFLYYQRATRVSLTVCQVDFE